MREDTGDVLGIVSDEYEVVDNRDAFRFLDALIGSELHFETGREPVGRPARVVPCPAPRVRRVGGDLSATYIYVANTHDGSMAVTAAATPIRIRCANTLGAALRQAEHGANAERTFRFWHTGNLQTKFAEAPKVLVIDEDTGQRARTNRERAIEQVLAIFRGRGTGGDTTGNSPGSKWVAFNAIAEHLDYGRRYTTRTNQVQRSFEDTTIKQRALELVMTA